MLVGSVFLVIGIGFGIYMGASGDTVYAPLHAHTNLLGFVLPMLFALAYRGFPQMGGNKLAVYHFWLHSVPVAVLLVMLFLLFSGTITEAGMVPLAPIAEIVVLISVLVFLYNAFKNAH